MTMQTGHPNCRLSAMPIVVAHYLALDLAGDDPGRRHVEPHLEHVRERRQEARVHPDPGHHSLSQATLSPCSLTVKAPTLTPKYVTRSVFERSSGSIRTTVQRIASSETPWNGTPAWKWSSFFKSLN